MTRNRNEIDSSDCLQKDCKNENQTSKSGCFDCYYYCGYDHDCGFCCENTIEVVCCWVEVVDRNDPVVLSSLAEAVHLSNLLAADLANLLLVVHLSIVQEEADLFESRVQQEVHDYYSCVDYPAISIDFPCDASSVLEAAVPRLRDLSFSFSLHHFLLDLMLPW